MKLTKSKLLKATNEELLKLGYLQIKDTLTGANGLFIKVIDDVYFLSLGLTISNYYDSRFTASFYLSKSIRWSSIWGDIPQESYERVGSFLTKKERRLYLDDEHNKQGVIDSWWSGDDEGIKNFLETVKITESRFLGQKNLFSKIKSSVEIKQFTDYASNVFKFIDENNDNKFNFQFTPNKKIDDIPVELFKAAEKTLSKKEGILNVNTVKALAADVWHQIQVRPQLSILFDKLTSVKNKQ